MERLLGRVAGAMSRQGSILCFHGVREGEEPGPGVLHVSATHLIELTAVVRAAGTIVPLTELLDRYSQGKATRGLFAITFDDAYASLLATADQWYTRAPFPVTVFVVGEASQSGTAFWWDRLDALTPVLTREEWKRLGDSVDLVASHSVDQATGAAMSRVVRDWVVTRRHGRAPAPFQGELARLEGVHGARARQRAMTVEELHQFGALGPVAFGAHTMTHAALSTIESGEVVMEIQSGWQAIRAWDLPHAVPILAAPYGALRPDLGSLASEAGMQATLALDDRRIGRPALRSGGSVVSRLSMVRGVTPGRLAYRISGLRELIEGRMERSMKQ